MPIKGSIQKYKQIILTINKANCRQTLDIHCNFDTTLCFSYLPISSNKHHRVCEFGGMCKQVTRALWECSIRSWSQSNTWFMDQQESVSHTASWSVHPFLHSSPVCPTQTNVRPRTGLSWKAVQLWSSDNMNVFSVSAGKTTLSV